MRLLSARYIRVFSQSAFYVIILPMSSRYISCCCCLPYINQIAADVCQTYQGASAFSLFFYITVLLLYTRYVRGLPLPAFYKSECCESLPDISQCFRCMPLIHQIFAVLCQIYQSVANVCHYSDAIFCHIDQSAAAVCPIDLPDIALTRQPGAAPLF